MTPGGMMHELLLQSHMASHGFNLSLQLIYLEVSPRFVELNPGHEDAANFAVMSNS